MSTLGGITASKAGLYWPRTGKWSAEVELVEPAVLAGPVVLSIGDLVLVGTIVRGGPVEGHARYLVEGGAGGWRTTIPAKAYRNDLGVKLSTILKDAAAAAGERVELGADRSVGSAYVRPAGPAGDVLTALAGPWWIDEAGTTQVRPRPSPPVVVPFRLVAWDRAKAIREIASEAIAPFVPGALLAVPGAAIETIEEVRIDVDHAATRLHVRTQGAAPAPLLASGRALLGRIIRREIAKLGIVVSYEYRVVSQAGPYVDLQAARKAAGLPDLRRVLARPMSGYSVTYTPGSLVLVAFVEGDEARPFIAFGGEVGASGTVPLTATVDAEQLVQLAHGSDSLNVDEELGRVVRYGDLVTLPTPAGPAVGPIKQSPASAPNNIARVNAV
jgi:hypothetical protein